MEQPKVLETRHLICPLFSLNSHGLAVPFLKAKMFTEMLSVKGILEVYLKSAVPWDHSS